MQDYLSTNKPVAFSIHPKQHNVKEKQWIKRDGGRWYTYLVPQAKRNQVSALSRSFSLQKKLLRSSSSPPKCHPLDIFLFLFFSDLPSQRSLLQPPLLPPFLPHSFCSHLFCHLFRPPPFLSHSLYNFKKWGWLLMATKDVTRGLLG